MQVHFSRLDKIILAYSLYTIIVKSVKLYKNMTCVYFKQDV